MEASCENNRVVVSGNVKEEPKFSHTLYGEDFYTFLLSIPRLSGVEDTLPVMAGERMLNILPQVGDMLYVTGQLRSYNMQQEGGNRLLITIFARSITPMPENEGFYNEIYLSGYICKPPVYRTTPFLREITDVLIAVNRPYHKSDYLPVIVWGRNARFASELTVGDKIIIKGRVQSRAYQKTMPDGTVLERIAYEVSAAALEQG